MTEFPRQRHKHPISEMAKRLNRSHRTVQTYLKMLGASKSREQYEADAQARRRIAYEMRESGLKWREIGEKLGISTTNAQMLAHRYKQSQNTI